MQRRRLVRKWAARKYSPQRLRAINECEKTAKEDFARRHQNVFETAESLLLNEGRKGIKLVFVGLGMRPLFEATRALNEAIKKMHRRDIVYIIAAPRLLSEEQKIRAFEEQLKKRNSDKTARYIIVDPTFTGGTAIRAASAAKLVNPKAEVQIIDQRQYWGLTHVDDMLRPTNRTSEGRQKAGTQNARSQYLVFQKHLQDYISCVMQDKRFATQRWADDYLERTRKP